MNYIGITLIQSGSGADSTERLVVTGFQTVTITATGIDDNLPPHK